MAKQGINPVEQHVEKIVLAVSVLLFVFVVFSYVISAPITVALNGQTISPYDLDRRLGDAADDLARAYKNARFMPPTASPDAAGSTEKALQDLRQNLAVLNSMPQTMTPAIAWWPQMNKPEGITFDVSAAHGIATVAAPVVSEASTGVTDAVLTPQPVDGFFES